MPVLKQSFTPIHLAQKRNSHTVEECNLNTVDDSQQVLILKPFMLKVGQCCLLPDSYLPFTFFFCQAFFLASSCKQTSKTKRKLITILGLNQLDSSKVKQSGGPFIRDVQVSQHSVRNASLESDKATGCPLTPPPNPPLRLGVGVESGGGEAGLQASAAAVTDAPI